MGYHRETTPTLDKMARRGLYFENAIVSGVATPVSLAGMFTGDYLIYFSNDFERIRKDILKKFKKQKTLAQALSQLGYSTGAFTPNIYASRYFGFNKGFKYFQDFLSESGDIGLFIKLEKKIDKIIKRTKVLSNILGIKYLLQKERACKPWESYYDQILEWVSKTDKPYFLWILLLSTHHPYLVPRKYRKWTNIFDMYYYNWKVRASNWQPSFTEKDRAKIVGLYDSSILYADAFIKRLWNDLKDDDPIFMIHADHGEGFGEHGFYGHNFPALYEELIHVPLVIYNADVKGKIEEPVSLLGVPSTILELIGEKSDFPTESFLNGGKDWVISKIFIDGKRVVAVRMKNWKFITGENYKDELYNLKKDPYEQENVIDSHPDLVKIMKEIVETHIKGELSKKLRIKLSKGRYS